MSELLFGNALGNSLGATLDAPGPSTVTKVNFNGDDLKPLPPIDRNLDGIDLAPGVLFSNGGGAAGGLTQAQQAAFAAGGGILTDATAQQFLAADPQAPVQPQSDLRSYSPDKNQGAWAIANKLDASNPRAAYGHLLASGQVIYDPKLNVPLTYSDREYSYDPTKYSDQQLAALAKLGGGALGAESAIRVQRMIASMPMPGATVEVVASPKMSFGDYQRLDKEMLDDKMARLGDQLRNAGRNPNVPTVSAYTPEMQAQAELAQTMRYANETLDATLGPLADTSRTLTGYAATPLLGAQQGGMNLADAMDTSRSTYDRVISGVKGAGDIAGSFAGLYGFLSPTVGNLGQGTILQQPLTRDGISSLWSDLNPVAPNTGSLADTGSMRFSPTLGESSYNPDAVNLRSAEFYKLYGNDPTRGTMTTLEARQWYLAEDTKIPDQINPLDPLEDQAHQMFDLRNVNRTEAREFMSDRITADRLYREEPNWTWDRMVDYRKSSGLSGDDVWRSIIDSSQKTRVSVNQKLGLH